MAAGSQDSTEKKLCQINREKRIIFKIKINPQTELYSWQEVTSARKIHTIPPPSDESTMQNKHNSYKT